MPCDWNYYYDFESERKITDWKTSFPAPGNFLLESEFESGGGDFVILAEIPPQPNPKAHFPDRIRINGKELEKSTSSSAYVRYMGARRGYPVRLEKGMNLLSVEGRSLSTEPGTLTEIAIIPALPRLPEGLPCRAGFTVPRAEFPKIPETPDASEKAGFRPGIGCSRMPGRFGFSKGDGVLDCGMPTLGSIDKMYLCGHPKYKKPFRWSYSTLPAGAALHGSYQPAETGIEKDSIDVNHLSVKWGAKFGDCDFSCTYSLATPGIITECSTGVMRISGLEFAGNYRYALVPDGGDAVRILPVGELAEGVREMSENFLLLFGSTEYPDLPLLIVFQKRPSSAEVKFNPVHGRLSEIVFASCPLVITATPFGIESFEPVSPDNRAFLGDAVNRARFWSRAFLAFPVRCEEYYRNDHDGKKTTVVQKFSYRHIRDEWGTEPFETAPLPPVTALCGFLETDSKFDFRFPTKFGALRGAAGNVSSYTLPQMPVARKFPLCEKGSPLPAKLGESLQSCFDFAARFPETIQPYPYAGALLEPYAYATTMMNFMDGGAREYLRKFAAERLAGACDPERVYDYPVINHGNMMRLRPDDRQVIDIYADPAMEHRILRNWYVRKEPFTGASYHICYLNLCLFSSGILKDGTQEELERVKYPLVENDWGAGLTFYYMYLCALASGDFGPIRKNWTHLKSVYSFFEKLQDWACMGTGYSDNAMLWVEGANYGIFTAFVNMAEAVGDRETYERAVYTAAKQFALRMGIIRSAQHYFYKYYDSEPWFITKALHEEGNPSWQFQTVPSELWRNRFRSDGVYNMTTEGIYPEIFESLRKFHPVEADAVFGRLRAALVDNLMDSTNNWAAMEECSAMLTDLALNPDAASEALRAEIELARERKLLLREWRGIHIYGRRLPATWFETQLLAWDAMKKHPLWLEHWEDLAIVSAEWDAASSTAEIVFSLTGNAPKLRLGLRRLPDESLLNGKRAEGVVRNETVEFRPAEAGTLVLRFS